MATSKIPIPSKAKYIYRFEMASGNVSANGSPTMTAGYTSTGSFHLSSDNKKIISDARRTVMISVHVAGLSGSTNRLWCKVIGGNINPQIIVSGSYVSGESVQMAQVNANGEIYVQFLEAFDINSGGVYPSTIFITELD